MTRTQYVIYHNPRCSKSRAALALLTGHGIEPRIVEYLETPPSRAELKAIVEKLGVKPEALVRKGEDVYQAKYRGKAMSDDQWIDALVADPILMERPVVVAGARAVVGRPPESVRELF